MKKLLHLVRPNFGEIQIGFLSASSREQWLLSARISLVTMVLLFSFGGSAIAQSLTLNPAEPIYCPGDNIMADFAYDNSASTSTYNVSFYLIPQGSTTGPLLGTASIPAMTNFSSNESFFTPTVNPGTYFLRADLQESNAGTGPTTATASSATFLIGPRINTTSINNAGPYCVGDPITANYTVDCPNQVSSVQLVLSDDTGSFASGTTTLNTSNTLNGSVSGTIPPTASAGNYRVRVEAFNALVTPEGSAPQFQVVVPILNTLALPNMGPYCAGDDIVIDYEETCLRSTPDFAGSNNGAVQVRISAPGGSFASGTQVLTPVSNITSGSGLASRNMTVTLPTNLATGNYRFRVETVGSDNFTTSITGTSNTAEINAAELNTTGASTGDFCQGDEITINYEQSCLANQSGYPDIQVRMSDPGGTFSATSPILETLIAPPGNGTIGSSTTTTQNGSIVVRLNQPIQPGGNNYRFRVELTSGFHTDADGFGDRTIYPPQLTTGNIVDPEPNQPFCPGDEIELEFSARCLGVDQDFSATRVGELQVIMTSASVPHTSTPIVPTMVAGNAGATLTLTGSIETNNTLTFLIPDDVPSALDYRFTIQTTNGFNTEPTDNVDGFGGTADGGVVGGNDDGQRKVSTLVIDNTPPGDGFVLLFQDGDPAAPNPVLCQGEVQNITFSSGDDYATNAEIRAVLSDAAGNFSPPNSSNNIVIGRAFNPGNQPTNQDIRVTIPLDQFGGTNYYIRLESTDKNIEGCTYGPFRIPQIRSITGLVDDLDACLGTGVNANLGSIASLEGQTYRWDKICSDPFTNNKEGLANILVSDIIVQSGGTYVYAATGEGLAKSTNDGDFVPFNDLNSGFVRSLYAEGNKLYAAEGSKLYVSVGNLPNLATNTGFNMYQPMGVGAINDIHVDGSNVYLATGNGLFVSTSGPGGTFTSANSLLGLSVNAVNTADGNIYAGTGQGLYIYRSGHTSVPEQYNVTNTNNSNGEPGISNNSIQDIHIDTDPLSNTLGYIFLATGDGIAISTDNGFSWDTYSQGINSVVFSVTTDNGRIYAGVGDGLAVTNIGGRKFTVYTVEDGIGFVNASVTRAWADGTTIIVGSTTGVSRTTNFAVTTGIAANQTSGSLADLVDIDYDDIRCRYYVTVSGTYDGKFCEARTGIARLPDVPGPINTTVYNEIETCEGVEGQILVNGLIPGVQYELIRSNPTSTDPDVNTNTSMLGQPLSGTVQADSMGRVLIYQLPAGLYQFEIQSKLNPNNCVSNTVTRLLEDPDPPALPVIQDPLPLGVCLGDQVTFTLDPLAMDEEYKWFTAVDMDNFGTTSASPGTSDPNGTNPVMYTLDGFPTTYNSLYVAKRSETTNCISEVVEAVYEIKPPTVISKSVTQATMATPTGSITINFSGLETTENYILSYEFIPEVGASSTETIPIAGTATSYTISPAALGEYKNIQLLPAAGSDACPSNIIPSCVIEVPPPVIDDAFVGEASSMTMGMGDRGAYLQNAIDGGCASDAFIPSGGIAVGRIRNPANPATTLDNQRVEMRGYVQFNLASLGIPENAIIDKVEYQPVSIDNGNQNVCGADPNGTPVQSVTGDVQFDVTQVNPLITTSVYTDPRWNDLGDVKYADFTIAKPFAPANTLAGAWTDLGPDAVADLEQRRINGQDFQVGLRLSGNDFDLAFYQFHGIVFADEDQHKLRITYHERDYGDLPEAKYATDALGGFEGPSHRLGSVDDNPSPTAETLLLNPLYIGTVPDAERTANDNAGADGDDNTDTDDEDITYSPGATFPGNNFFNVLTNDILVAGDTIRVEIPYTNDLTSVPGQLSIYFDWNNNGVFENDTERYTTSLGTGTGVHTFNIDIPFDAANADIGVRIRFTTADIDAYGAAPNGEVEDLLVRSYSFDYGDLPDATDPADPTPGLLTATGDYNTFWTEDGLRGPRALIDDRLSIGNLTDAEGNGQPEANAFGDDINGIDDEDGIIPPDTIRRDEPAIFYVFVKNLIPDPAPADDGIASAYLVGYVDWNDDGDFEDAFEQSSLIPINASGQFEVAFTVPPTPIPLPDEVAARFRLSSNPAVATMAIGPSDADLVSVGEIEDLFVNIVAYDWGDLPEPKFATDSEGGYPGPSHKIVSEPNALPPGFPSLYFGPTEPDAEKNGQPTAMADGDDQEVNLPTEPGYDPDQITRYDDEDLEQIGLYFKNQDPFKMVADADPALLESGDQVILELPVTNNTGRDAYLTAYFDWNDNGLFEGATESYRILIDQQGTDTYQIPFTIPGSTPTAMIGVRVRLSTLETIDAYGPAPDGEVEDFLIDVKQFDYGDLPDDDSPTVTGALTGRLDYHTFYSLDGSRGPRHIINEDLSIGTTVDAEGNGQPQANAFGDDINGIDDEDGIIRPDTIIRDKPAIFQVFVKNLLDRPAYLRGFVDWNDNGDFEDDPVYEKSAIIEIPVGASGYYEVSFTVPPMPVPLPDRVGARFRLSDSEMAVSLSTGPASPSNDPPGVDVIGEVHDLFVPIAGFDWGDLPEPQYITDREGGYPGPSHKIVYIDLDRLTTEQIADNPEGIPNLQIGDTAPDAENEGIPTEKADGDDEIVLAADAPSPGGARIDDEDLSFLDFVRPGTMMTDSIVAGEPIDLIVPVGNYTLRNANLLVFVDWNGDGDFEDEEETKWVTVTPIELFVTPVDYRVSFDIPMRGEADSVGVRVRLTTGEFFDPYGQAADGEVEDFVIEVKGTDYGDLPDITAGTAINDFQTVRAYDGPRHAVPVTPLLYLGDRIDTEEDGIPGLESIGDDENQIVDDEDGIIFLTPLAPGKEASIAFSGTNNTDLPATIFMYADWENDGVLDLVTLSQNTIAAGATVDGQIATFTVPTTATFTEGNAFFRFRITTDAEFIASPSPNGLARTGEVEDYYVPVFQIGNLVWEDRNNNGRQDPEEIPLGIEGVRVVLRFGGVDEFTGAYDAINQTTILDPTTTALDGDNVEDYICETFTAEDGTYSFFAMIEGNYQLISVDTFNLTPSRADWIDFVTEEDLDNDGLALKAPWEYADGEIRQAKTQVFNLNRDSVATDEEGILDQLNPSLLDPNQRITLPDNKVEHRIDFAYTAFDFGDLLNTYGTEENGMTIGENVSGIFPTDSVKVGNPLEGPKHIVTPEIYLGPCADAEEEGQPDIDAGQEVFNGQGVMPVADGLGDNPNDTGWNTTDQQDTLNCVNDETGVTFLTPLVPGSEAIISVAFQTSINNDGPDAFLQAYFDWNGDGDFYLDPADPSAGLDPDEQIIFTYLNDDTLFLEPNTNAVELELSYQLDANPVILKFNVPEGALFQDGNFLGRFRIGKEPNLGPTGILPGNENFEDGIVPLGEVEDYFLNLVRTSNGNIVWEDRDYDGIQDLDEPVIPGVKVTLEYAGSDNIFGNDPFERTYMTETDANGAFIFAGLIGQEPPTESRPKYYRFIVEDPDNMTPTVNRDTFGVFDLSNCVAYNSDGYDSNIDDRTTENFFRIDDPLMMCVGEMNPVGKNDIGPLDVLPPDNVWPDNQIDETIDFGFVGFDYGDLPDTSSVDATPEPYDFITLRDWLPGDPNYMGPRHAIQPKLYLGNGVDGELNAQPDLDAGSKAGGDDDFPGEDPIPFTQGDAGADDETGIRLLSPLLPGEVAYIRVDYTSQDTMLSGGYRDTTAHLNAFIDWNGDGDFYDGAMYDTGEKIEFTHMGDTLLLFDGTNGMEDITDTDNPELAGGVDTFQILAFTVPDTLTAQFYEGTAFMRFRLSFEGDLDADNRRYHKAGGAQVVLDTEPAANLAGTIPQQVDALDWMWAAPLQEYPRGEVEDYAIPLAKIGNLAWYDHNVNGRQDDIAATLYNTYADEYGVDTLHLVLIWGGVDDETGTFDEVGFQDADQESKGNTIDIQYNLTIAPPTDDYGPQIIKTNSQGLYSFRGLIPGNYNLIPLKYLQEDSTAFVNFWPKHRVLTVKNNSVVSDSLDSDAGPGAAFTIADNNPREPEVCVDDLPLGEDGQLDEFDRLNANMGWGITGYDPSFPDSLYDQTIDLGWVDEPNIEANLDLVGVDFPTTQTCGNFNVIYRLCLKNPTETPLDSIVPFLNIAGGYGDAFIRGTAQVSIVEQGYLAKWVADSLGVDNCEEQDIAMEGSVGDLSQYINPNYDGVVDTFLLTGGDVDSRFYLPGDSVICLQIEFEVNPDEYAAAVAGGNDCPWMLRGGSYARAVGFTYDATISDPWTGGDTKVGLIDWMPKDGNGDNNPRFGLPIEVYDLSDEFDDPSFNETDGKMAADSIQFEGYVVDRGDVGEYQLFDVFSRTGRDKYLDEDDYTVQNDECWEKTKNPSVNDNIILSLDADCEIKLDARNFVNNYEEECGFDTYPEGSYYRVIIKDEHTGEVLWASVDRLPFEASRYLDRKLIYEVRAVADFCTVTWGRITIEDKKPPIVTCADDIDKDDTNNMLLNAIAPLVCTDIDSILNNSRSYLDSTYAYFTGIATAEDNCNGEVIFDGANDVLQVFSDCEVSAANGYAYAKITRTFLFRDVYGNEANCKQEIYFYRPQIILPSCEIDLYRYDVGDDRTLTPEDLVNKYEEAESVPYIINAAGDRVYLTDETICGFGIRYENESTFVSDECTFKIEREWRIFDWCYSTDTDYPDYLDTQTNAGACYADATREGNVYIFKQLLKVEDRVDPIVRIPDFDEDGFKGTNGYKGGPDAEPTVSTPTYDADDVYEFSTQGTDCLANFSVTKDMFEVEEDGEWCFDLQDIVVRQPVLDLDDRPIPGQYEVVVDEQAQISGSCEEGGFWVDEVRMRLDTSEHYLMELRFYDECGNDTLIYAPFEVVDDIKPVVICTDELRVTYDNLGTGNVAAVDVDEGTYDNCGKIIWLKVRRPVLDCEDGFRSMLSYVDANNNSIIDESDYIDENDNNRADSLEYFRFNEDGELMSPLLDKVNFFCCDPDSVKVELWASDKFGNVSNCWQYAVLENRPPLVYDLPGNYILPNDRVINCEREPQLQALLQSAGTYAEGSLTYRAAVELLGGDLFISLNVGCAVYTKQINVRPEVDQCGEGEIYISWTLSNGEDELTTVERVLTIRGSYDYWLKFPRDVYANCTDPNIAGVEYEANGCDLIAISQLPDERFDTPQDPNSCYKLLRTYRVINWCEYDGESAPVVVSRDWDAHNGADLGDAKCGTTAGTRNPNAEAPFFDDVDAGEYNLNPMEPDGDGQPGDEDIYVIVDIDNADGPNPFDSNGNGDLDIGEYDIVYYDNNANPFDNSTADLWGDDDVSGRLFNYPWANEFGTVQDETNGRNDEGYWWAVVRGEDSCESPGQSAWYDDDADGSNTDVDGNDGADDTDNRYGSFGYWQYTQHIVVYDAIDPELTVVSQDTFYSINAVDCDAQVSIEIDAEDLCNGFSNSVELQVVVDGVDASDGLVAGVFTGRYAEGEHELIISASDACRNTAVYRQTFVVADGKAPAPIVHEDLVAELSEMDVDGEEVVQAEVWASDFVASDIYDCNGQDATQTDANGNALVTKYSINVVGDSVDMDQTGLVFTCADANQMVDVEIHAWDEAGNHDYVVTSVLVQDNNGLCDVAAGSGQISGGIATEDNARVNEVEVRLSGADQRSFLTNATGSYSFEDLQEGGDFTVIPSKDDFHENGISTFDVILMQKHIVGSGLLTSPYQQIAADVNRSGTITTLDLIQLRKIVLGIDTRFADNTSWRFVDAEYRFQTGVSALTQAFAEVKNINNLAGAEEANFFAIKTGDLNGSAAAYVQPRSGDALRIEASASNRQLQAGQEYRIDFRSSELARVQGYQFTLELGAGIELVDMVYGQAQAEHFGVFAERGVITTSWNGTAQGNDLFSLVIKPDAAVMLEDALQLTSHYTAAEAYNASDEVMDVQLDWSLPVELADHSALYQNEPNPFAGETQISFRLAEADRASLRIRDVQGRLVMQLEGDYAAGVHQVRIKRSELPSAGVYYYTLQSGDFIATKKMILLE